MAQLYLLKGLLLAGSLLLVTAGAAQVAPAAADSVPQSPQVLYKLGLRLTHLRYAHDSRAWQFLLPLSLGVEYRLAPHLSLYTQFEADMLTSYTSGRRRAKQCPVGCLGGAGRTLLTATWATPRRYLAATWPSKAAPTGSSCATPAWCR